MYELTHNDIESVGLLSAEEYEKNKTLIPLLRSWWWLRSPGAYNNNAAYVFADGDIYPDGYFVYKEAGVRPAFTLCAETASKLMPGDPVLVGDYTATVISGEKCLLDKCVCKHIFDNESNSWKTSEIKTYLESEDFLQSVLLKKER